MMDKDILIMYLQNVMSTISEEENIDQQNIHVYLFGSARYKKEYNDIDILVTYNSVDYAKILLVRQIMYNKLNGILKKRIDITLLTDNEAKDTNFIVEENCELVF